MQPAVKIITLVVEPERRT